MSEKRFLSFIFTEGFLLVLLGIILFVLPKISEVSFGFLLCLIMIIYGGYKICTSFLTKNFDNRYIFETVNSLLLLTAGLLMFFTRSVNLIVITSLLGIYFILESISINSFLIRIQKIFSGLRFGVLVSLLKLLFGIILISISPSLWIGGMFLGIDFIITGNFLINMYVSKKNLN